MKGEQADGSSLRDDSKDIEETADGSNYREDAASDADDVADGSNYRESEDPGSRPADGSNYDRGPESSG